MRHVFRATKMGWEQEQEVIWFDSDRYTREEAEAQFKPFQGISQRGHAYTGYEYGGQKYYDVMYLGEYENDKMPRNNDDYLDSLIEREK